MAQNGMTLDTREFNQALRQYVVASGKDFSEAVNKQAVNVALRTAQFTPKAQRSEIQNLAMRPWFPKMIAKDMRKRSKGVKVRKRKTEDGKTVKWESSYTSKQARARARKILAARKRGIAFLKSAWAKAGRSLGGTAKKSQLKDNLTKSKGYGTRATPQQLVAQIFVEYQEATSAKANSAVQKVNPSLQQSITWVARDMMKYVESKLDQRAKQFSGR